MISWSASPATWLISWKWKQRKSNVPSGRVKVLPFYVCVDLEYGMISGSASPTVADSPGNPMSPPPSYHDIPGTVPAHQGASRGPPPSYEEAVDPNGTEKQCGESVTFWYRSESSDPYICPTHPDVDPGRPKNLRIRMRIRNTVKKSQRSHKTVEVKVFLTIFAWWWKDPEPVSYLWLMDPDADPGGPKTYGSFGSGCGCGTLLKSHKEVTKQ